MRRPKVLHAAAAAAILAAAACGGSDSPAAPPPSTPPPSTPPPTGTVEVVMTGSTFSPQSVTIARNATVRWRNADGVQHNSVSTAGAGWNSGVLNAGATFQQTFTTAGTFPYSCTLHPGMNGTVIVQ